MRIVDQDGKCRYSWEEIENGPPKFKTIKIKDEDAANKDEEEDGPSPNKASFSQATHYEALHRNFPTWRSMPPGWKRKLLAEIEPPALGITATGVLKKKVPLHRLQLG